MCEGSWQTILALADTISDRIISLLNRVEQTTDFQLPPFSLALDLPEPEPGPDTPLAFEQPTLTYNEEEPVQLTREGKTEHAQEILRQANKTPEDLKSNPAFQNILEHSERLHQQSRRLGGGSSATKADRRLLIMAFHRLFCGIILQRERTVFVRIVLEFREALATADPNVLALILRIQRFPN